MLASHSYADAAPGNRTGSHSAGATSTPIPNGRRQGRVALARRKLKVFVWRLEKSKVTWAVVGVAYVVLYALFITRRI